MIHNTHGVRPMTHKNSILLVSQNQVSVDVVTAALATRGQTPEVVTNLTERQGRDDRVLPVVWDASNDTHLKDCRKTFPAAGILLLCSRDQGQVLAGLESGADDFILLPFGEQEFLARVDALSIRARTREQSRLCYGPLAMDIPHRRVHWGEKPISLTPTEFRILEMLLRHRGNVVTRTMLCDSLWEPDWEGVTNVIEVHINRLRSKLNNVGSPKLIRTVRGSGYQFVEEDLQQMAPA